MQSALRLNMSTPGTSSDSLTVYVHTLVLWSERPVFFVEDRQWSSDSIVRLRQVLYQTEPVDEVVFTDLTKFDV